MFNNIEELIAKSQGRGGHFFDADTMDFFGSIVYPTVYDGRYFITSEQDRGIVVRDGTIRRAWDGRRLFTIRQCDDEGFVNTVGEFGAYDTKFEAETAIYRMLGSKSES